MLYYIILQNVILFIKQSTVNGVEKVTLPFLRVKIREAKIGSERDC